ncbi:MAG: hypothetical protein GC159_05790 [Phycisphaera sp.]|nr:hypothetical protein [Phycisphaera sp.]
MHEHLSELYKSLQAAAIDAGAVFHSTHVDVPLTAFSVPGVFAALRCRTIPLTCAHCHGPEVIRSGVRNKGNHRVQQFRCLNPKCSTTTTEIGALFGTRTRKHVKTSGHFREYDGTPLEGSTLSAMEWFAIWHWRYVYDGKATHPKIAEALKISESVTKKVATTYLMTKSHSRRGRNKRNPAYLFDQRREPYFNVVTYDIDNRADLVIENLRMKLTPALEPKFPGDVGDEARKRIQSRWHNDRNTDQTLCAGEKPIIVQKPLIQ